MTSFEQYRDGFVHVDLARRDRILQLTLHTEGRGLVWGRAAHDEVRDALRSAAGDAENRALILIGVGGVFVGPADPADPPPQAGLGPEITRALLDVDGPIVAAVNGPAGALSGLLVLADQVLAAPTATFEGVRADDTEGVAGGLSARAARRLGLVTEVVHADLLLPRAWAVAEHLLSRPTPDRRSARRWPADAARRDPS